MLRVFRGKGRVMLKITQAELNNLAIKAAAKIPPGKKIYGVPRGGVSAALVIAGHSDLTVVDDPDVADVIVDDLIDSGRTLQKWAEMFPEKQFVALIDKREPGGYHGQWLMFPWEGDSASGIEDNIVRLLQFVGEDSEREGLQETPKRVAKAWQHWCGGYEKNPADILKVFEDGAEDCDEMVVVKDIPIYSHCEHHLAPIFGTATIAYIPDGKIVGLSKLSRLADMYARRLQVQERLTNQIARALEDHLSPRGAGVVIKARHLCMESRGICQQGHYTITSSLRGVMRDDARARAEFLELCQ